MAAGLGARLAHEHVDLGELPVERGALVAQPGGEPRRRRAAWSSLVIVLADPPERVGAQSSGIRIQPWRIAYTTAWVRSLTESFRRMELMWFLTVCSLIDSA